jgi:hypothetical protein
MLAAMVAGDGPPMTEALRVALSGVRDAASFADLVFLEQWERYPLPGAAAARRIGQIRRANPSLAAAIRAEVKTGRPLTEGERAALMPVPVGG